MFFSFQAVPWFLLFIALEIGYSAYKGKKNYYKTNDALTSIGAGILQQSVKYSTLSKFVTVLYFSCYFIRRLGIISLWISFFVFCCDLETCFFCWGWFFMVWNFLLLVGFMNTMQLSVYLGIRLGHGLLRFFQSILHIIGFIVQFMVTTRIC